MGFVVTGVVVTTVVHLYLWWRLVCATTLPGRLRRTLTWVAVAFGVLVPVTMVIQRVPAPHFPGWLAWPGFLWIAVMFYLLVFLVLLEVPRAVAALVLRWRAVPSGEKADVRTPPAVPATVGASAAPPVAPADSPPPVPATQDRAAQDRAAQDRVAMGRRLFLGRTAAAVAGAGALATVGVGVRTALGDPVIERVAVRIPGLDARLDGLRFAVVSDIHIGPLTGRAHTERIVRMINSLEADVVAIVGDLVDGTVAELGALARPLRSLESAHGAYFVTGNHEYYTANGPAEWIAELRELGVRPLENERVEIARGGAVLDLAGVNDVYGEPEGQGPDFTAALGGRDTSRTTVLLAHQPVQVTQAAAHGVDLQLSGHTHGGQMVPFNLIVPFQQPVVRGLATVDGTQVYVTRGAGFWGPPVRVGAPPEITMLRIHR
ncbi:metallophosphoesterase [Spongiactinospora sp. TRM90649]|uniref:metallophosphoesterase n=1 Tax=Spongiactinospora sp. TRM90649 TaxID=3031114 RepID=UPI0023F8B2CC|nr:metallophosphoesterase [Spongiactinospora sp. TRM90649]MDF5759079.1 metallophosphoesterase [Spongiactinospora sp. TRM90649]